MRKLVALRRILGDAFGHFNDDDGWSMASHLAITALMALFPFLIFATTLASFLGANAFADTAVHLVFDTWPDEIAEPIAREVRSVLTAVRKDALTLGAILALYFSSSGVEAVRVGLNRAYEAYEWRSWWRTRLESIVYVVGGAAFMLAFSLLVVLGPLLWRGIVGFAPALAPLGFVLAFLRITGATVLVVLALSVAHKLLPARSPHIGAMWPGIVMTLVVWLIGGVGFG